MYLRAVTVIETVNVGHFVLRSVMVVITVSSSSRLVGLNIVRFTCLQCTLVEFTTCQLVNTVNTVTMNTPSVGLPSSAYAKSESFQCLKRPYTTNCPVSHWRRPPGFPRNRWLDQLHRDNSTPPADFWWRATSPTTRGHSGWRYGLRSSYDYTLMMTTTALNHYAQRL